MVDRPVAQYGVDLSTHDEAGELAIKPLTIDTWDALADLAERHNGVWNG